MGKLEALLVVDHTPSCGVVGFFRRTDWLAQDAKKEAEFGVEHPQKGSVRHGLGQVWDFVCACVRLGL